MGEKSRGSGIRQIDTLRGVHILSFFIILAYVKSYCVWTFALLFWAIYNALLKFEKSKCAYLG